MLSQSLRDQIWKLYRPGQCDDWSPSEEYCAVAKSCLLYLAKKENIQINGEETKLKLYDWLRSKI
jgi:hypothetical protein